MLKLREDAERGAGKREFIINEINNVGGNRKRIYYKEYPFQYLFICLIKAVRMRNDQHQYEQNIAVQYCCEVKHQAAPHYLQESTCRHFTKRRDIEQVKANTAKRIK